MNLQDKVFETATDLRGRAAALTQVALEAALTQAQVASSRVSKLKISLGTLQVAGRELNKVARRHVTRFVKQNSSIARDAGKEFSALARSTFQQLSRHDTDPARKARKPAARKRAAKAA